MPNPGVMRAAVYRGVDRVEVEELPVPEIGEGELLLRVLACGVCGTDLKKIRHGLAEPPRVFGHETAGEVAAVGPGESEWRVGQRVVVHHHVPCGDCFYCARRLYSCCAGYRRTGVTAGFEPAGGGFAEYARVLPFVRRGIVAIPDGVTDEEATFLEPLNTVLKGAEILRPERGETALVIGQGPIGLLFTQVLRLRGAEVVGSDPIPFRRRTALSLGAAAAVDPARADVPALCRERTEGRGADMAVVAVPAGAAAGEALRALRPGGRALLFAQTRIGEMVELDAGEVCVQEKSLLGSYSADIGLQPLAADLVFSRRIRTAELVTHSFPLERIGEALALAARPAAESLKVVVRP